MDFRSNNVKNPQVPVRQLQNGGWFWISRSTFQKYASKIGFSAIAVYCFLASMTDENQKCFPSQKYIALHLECSRATVNRAIKILERNQLIYLEKENRNHNVYFLLDGSSNNSNPQMSHDRNSDVQKQDTNDTNEQVINNNNVVCVKNNGKENISRNKREGLLAHDIATSLNDPGNEKTYRYYAHKYPEPFLRKILSEVKQTPDHKIKKSRGALFTYLLHFYETK